MTVSANLFSRFTRVISSYANALITAAEDPEKILDQTVNEMNGDLIKMRQATAQVMASQKQLENNITRRKRPRTIGTSERSWRLKKETTI